MEAEQVARNDAIFREANERIAEAAAALGEVPRVPFICECADARCRDVVLLKLVEYEQLRANPTLFLNRPGHERAAGGHARVVEVHDDYVVVEKVGRAAEVVSELEPRGG